MAKKITTAAARKAIEAGKAVKVIRRRDEEGEVIEVEVPDEPIEKAKVRIDVDTRADAMKRRKMAEKHLKEVTGKDAKSVNVRKAIQEGIDAIDKKLGSM